MYFRSSRCFEISIMDIPFTFKITTKPTGAKNFGLTPESKEIPQNLRMLRLKNQKPLNLKLKKLSDTITSVVSPASSKPRNYWQNISQRSRRLSGNQNLLKDLDSSSNLMASLLTTGISKTSLYKYKGTTEGTLNSLLTKLKSRVFGVRRGLLFDVFAVEGDGE
ncbi:4958_t:CDS:2, partial [Rhizophagus irregularis]